MTNSPSSNRACGVVEKYLWQDATTLLAVLDATDAVLQRFEYADGRMPVAMTYQGAVYYFAYDQVGSLKLVTDAAGSVVKRVAYDSFGNILSDSNPSFTVPFGFAGGLHDRNTGLVRFGARDYDPATGKWTAKDPIGFAGGDLNLMSYVDIVGKPSIQTNLYLYTSANPINIIDPSGLRGIWDYGGPDSPLNGLFRQINAYDKVTRRLGYAVGQEVKWWAELTADEVFQLLLMPGAPVIITINPEALPIDPLKDPLHTSPISGCDI